MGVSSHLSSNAKLQQTSLFCSMIGKMCRPCFLLCTVSFIDLTENCAVIICIEYLHVLENVEFNAFVTICRNVQLSLMEKGCIAAGTQGHYHSHSIALSDLYAFFESSEKCGLCATSYECISSTLVACVCSVSELKDAYQNRDLAFLLGPASCNVGSS